MRPGLLSCALLSLLALFSCRKPSGTNWDVGLALPVVDSRLNVANFVPDSLVSPDSTGQLHFHVKREVASLMLDSLLSLPDTLLGDTLRAPFPVALQPGQQVNLFPPSELTFNIGGDIELTVADIRTGFLNVTFSNEVSEPLDLIYRIASATKNGQVFEIRETIPPGQNALTKSYDLAGFRLNLRGEQGGKYNTIVQTYTLGLNAAANPVTVPMNQGVILSIGYSDISPQYVEGYFGQETFEVSSDTTDFGVLSNFEADNFMLSDATMKFTVLNQFGADFIASLSGITSINTVKNSNVTLSNSKLTRIPINWPTRTWEAVKASTTSIVFNSANSNIVGFISNLPDRISYQGSVRINPPPAGDAVGHSNYAFYGAGIRILADLDIPLRFRADRFRLQTVAETDFTNTRQLDNVKGGHFIIDVTNGFPFAARLQVYMRDENAVVIDSLFVPGENTIQSGQLGADNEVVSPSVTELWIPVNSQKTANLRRCRSLLIRSTLLLPPAPPDISIYENYEFDVKIRAEMTYNVGIRN